MFGPWCLVFLISLIWLLSIPSLAQVQPQGDLTGKNVLILHSFEANVPVFLRTDSGLSTTLQSSGVSSLNQFFVSLDLSLNADPKYRKLLVDKMRMQYGDRKIDVIVTMYPEALEFILRDCRDIFPGVPVVALYLPQSLELPKTGRTIIGHSATFDIRGTIEIALNLVQGVKRVYVVSGVYEVDRRIRDQARRDLKKWENRLEFLYLNHMSVEDILATVSNAPPGSIILLLVLGQDIKGKRYTYPVVAQRLSQVSAAPIFGILDTGLGYGIVGGSLINFESIGSKTGELVLDILKGIPSPRNASEILNVPPMPMFDWRQIRRWNLSVDAVPKGSIIINREFSLWDYKYYIIGGIAILLAQTALVIGLLVQRRRKNLAEESLRESQKELRSLSSRLLTAEETERRRISGELHDELGVALAVLKLRLNSAGRNLGENQLKLRGELGNNLKYIDEIIESVDRLSRDLSPTILQDLGLTAGLRWLIDNFAKNYSIKVTCDIANIDHLFSPESQIRIYRILQEALTNVGKHAQAKIVSVVIKEEGDCISFFLEDDGRGFDLEQAGTRGAAERGLGLASMDERVRMLGGCLDLRSQEGKGTRITFTIPTKRGGILLSRRQRNSR